MPHCRRVAFHERVHGDALDHHLVPGGRSVNDFFSGLDAFVDAHFPTGDLMRLDRKLFGNDRDDDFSRVAPQTMRAVVLANQRVPLDGDAGTVFELDDHTSGVRVTDNRPPDTVITEDRSLSHHGRPRADLMPRGRRLFVAVLAVAGVSDDAR